MILSTKISYRKSECFTKFSNQCRSYIFYFFIFYDNSSLTHINNLDQVLHKSRIKGQANNRSLNPAYHKKLILQQAIQSKTNEITGFLSSDYLIETYFLSYVYENENYLVNYLGDDKLIVQIQKSSIISNKNYSLKKLIDLYSLSYQERVATEYIYIDKDNISKLEFHVENYKLDSTYFSFDGNNFQNSGSNGQFGQLTYGVGNQYIIGKPELIIEEKSKLPPPPQFIKQQIEFFAQEMQFPQQLVKEYHNDFIKEFGLRLNIWVLRMQIALN